MLGASDYFVRKYSKRTPFHASSFHFDVHFILAELHKIYMKVANVVHPTFLYFMQAKLQNQRDY